MKKHPKTTAFVLAVLFIFAGASTAIAADPKNKDEKKIIAVLPFDNEGDKAWGRNAAEYLETLIVEAGKMRVVERKKLDKVLNEHAMGQFGLTQTAKQLGKFMAVDYLLGGSITPVGDSYSLNAKLIEIETAEIEVAKSVTFKDLSKLRWACSIIVSAISDRLYGSGTGTSKKELFGMTDSRQFFDAAQYLINAVEKIGSNVTGSVDEVDLKAKKIFIIVKNSQGIRPGIKLIIEADGFEGKEVVGTLYLINHRQGGRSEAGYLQAPSSLEMGQAFTSVGYKNKIAVGIFEDAEEENAEFTKQFSKTLVETLGNSSSMEFAAGTESISSQVTAANMKDKLKEMFKKGADLFVTGRFVGSAGSRRLELKVYNCYDGSVVKSVTIETKL